jgi:hypothetical protein
MGTAAMCEKVEQSKVESWEDKMGSLIAKYGSSPLGSPRCYDSWLPTREGQAWLGDRKGNKDKDEAAIRGLVIILTVPRLNSNRKNILATENTEGTEKLFDTD